MEDDEIIIGIEPKKDSKNNKSKKNKKKKSKNSTSKKKTTDSKNDSKGKVVKTIGIIILILLLTIILLCSSLFNIKQVNVSGNNKLSNEKIISLSSLELYTNIFKFKKSNIKQNLKENAYIEDVKITRKLPNTVNIDVVEREANFMLQFADSYVYINNQGYMLDISNEKLDVPILVGFTTDLSNIKAGNRINVDDLKKMNTVIKVYDCTNTNEISGLIAKIDISNPKNYSIALKNQDVVVYLGDCSDYSDLKTRILYLKALIELEDFAGKSGELFLNVDLNTEHFYFREKIG